MNYNSDMIINSVKRTMHIEAEEINRLINTVDESTVKLVNLLSETKGKIIITGMGKSGHIAKKICATMSSLGTPTLFLHPSEALHGDLGIVEERDTIVMISNSGETDELVQLISSIVKINCKLVGIFCKENSSLQQYCEHTVVLPINKEACINNLAPTTSTTVTLAYGDAIAIALSEMKDFNKDDFALYHPKGTLGKKLLSIVDNLNNIPVEEISVNSNEFVEAVLWVITKNRLGSVSVTNESGELIGILTDGDIRRLLEKKKDISTTLVSDAMTKNPIKVKAGTLAMEAYNVMQDNKISALPIVSENGTMVGMVSLYNIIDLGIIR